MRRLWLLSSMLIALLAASQAYALPDLVVSDIELIPSVPEPGMGTVRGSLTNIGPDATDLPFTELIDYAIFLDGSLCDSGVLVGDIDPAQTVTVETGACNPSTDGTFAIRVEVDTEFDVSEENEVNNTRSETFTWSVSAVPSLGPLGLAMLVGALILLKWRTKPARIGA